MDGSHPLNGMRNMLSKRLTQSDDPRLAAIVAEVMDAVTGIVEKHRVTPADLRQVISFASDVGFATDEKRDEWVLLADALGLTAAVESAAIARPEAATPQTLLGPFFRDGAPRKENGDSLSIDGVGVPLFFEATVVDLDGDPIAGAKVDVWHANGQGQFENQNPDSQPDFNLRGCLVTDAAGRVSFRTVHPGGYSLPDDGPVARLLRRLGVSITRPAHIQFRIEAEGFQTLVTHVFDRNDPHIACDPLFCVTPALLADFGDADDPGGAVARFTFKLARSEAAAQTC